MRGAGVGVRAGVRREVCVGVRRSAGYRPVLGLLVIRAARCRRKGLIPLALPGGIEPPFQP
jgi:hypothetical protein